MNKGKKESKPPMQINESKSAGSILENKNLNMKRKKESDLLELCRNRNVKQKVKQKIIKKSYKDPKSLNVPSMKYNKEMYEYQIQQLNLQFQQSLQYPTLTQDELKVLFMKYKSDGHYRSNENLPPFTSLLNNMHNVINEKNYFNDQTQSVLVSNVEKKCFENNEDVPTNTNTNIDSLNDNQYENPNMYKTLQPYMKHDVLQFTDSLNINNLSNKIENRHLYNYDITSTNNNNYNMYTNYNEQMHDNTNTSDNVEYFSETKSISNVKRVTDVEGKAEHFSTNLTNAQNILPEERESCRYADRNILCNISDLNAQCENSSNSNELPQQNDVHCSFQDNSFSFSSNFYDFYLNKWNNITLLNKNLESYCSTKNSDISHQLTLTKDHSKEQGKLDSPVCTNPYYLAHNKNMVHLSNEDISYIPENFHALHATNSNTVADNFLSETNTFISPCTNTTDKYN